MTEVEEEIELGWALTVAYEKLESALAGESAALEEVARLEKYVAELQARANRGPFVHGA